MIALVTMLVLASPCTAAPAPRLVANWLARPITLDGELEEAEWTSTPSSGAFAGLDGRPVSPHTELRALWTKEALVLGVYSADQDLRSSDVVHLKVGELLLEVSAAGKLVQPVAGVRVAVERDGSLDEDGTGEDDEEWLVEVSIPWSALGLKVAPRELSVAAWREDLPKGASRRTVSWHHDCSGQPAAGVIELLPAPRPSPHRGRGSP
ncbi:MAG: hypothetical protein U0228_20020 [Myxococcaceae bacterium]